MKILGIKTGYKKGFTIVELAVVVAVIGVLASVIIVGYGQWHKQTIERTMKSDLIQVQAQIEQERNKEHGAYPASLAVVNDNRGFTPSGQNELEYNTGTTGYCVEVTNPQTEKVFSIKNGSTAAQEGGCENSNLAKNGDFMQYIHRDICPTERIYGVDFRDKHTYWLKKMPDGQCWMLTNLAYEGGGNNRFVDADVGGLGPCNVNYTSYVYTSPRCYISSTASAPTVSPAVPSTSTDGGVASRDFGYLYNWCAVTGGQFGTIGCSNTSTTPYMDTATVCPGGWMVPTRAQYRALFSALGADEDTGGAVLNQQWLMRLGGAWMGEVNGSSDEGEMAYYWTANAESGSGGKQYAYHIAEYGGYLDDAGSIDKWIGMSVRCIAE